jgi:hypothetical protein
MQIGWATSRCRFSPEEGYGVGDDCVSLKLNVVNTHIINEKYIYIYRMDLHLIPIEPLYGQMVQLFIPKVKLKLDVKLEM